MPIAIDLTIAAVAQRNARRLWCTISLVPPPHNPHLFVPVALASGRAAGLMSSGWVEEMMATQCQARRELIGEGAWRPRWCEYDRDDEPPAEPEPEPELSRGPRL